MGDCGFETAENRTQTAYLEVSCPNTLTQQNRQLVNSEVAETEFINRMQLTAAILTLFVQLKINFFID